MWNTPFGERTLIGAERRLIMNAGWGLADSISGAAMCNEGVRLGIVLFDRLTWQQQMMMLEKVLKPLVEPSLPAPQSSALLEATVAAIYSHLFESVEIELDTARMDENDEYDTGSHYDVRKEILDALLEPVDVDEPVELPPEEGWPSVDSDDIEEWELAIQCLRGRMLADEDWQMESITMDLAPQSSRSFKNDLGIHRDYFIDIPPDGSDEEAEAARLRIVSLGRRILSEPEF